MGRKSKQETEEEVEVVQFDAVDFCRDIEEIARQKETAAEYTGNVGQATKQCAERSGLHKKVIGLTTWLHMQEPAKRTTVVTDLIKALNAKGYLDEGDFFDTPRKHMPGADEESEEEQQASQSEKNAALINKNIKPLDGDSPGSYSVN